MFLNLHMIQTFPASNLNRDDTGAPKDVIFGGHKRSRISSQCQKRSIRTHPSFRRRIEESGGDLGVRTARLTERLQEIFQNAGRPDEEIEKTIEAILKAIGIKKASKSEKTQYLLFLGNKEIEELADIALDHWQEAVKDSKKPEFEKTTEKQMKTILSERAKKSGYAADIALFGRMMADDKNLNVDAACQVAHAVGTSANSLQTDFYTAVDDLLPEDESGAGMMGIIEFTSATYYRYADIDLNKLSENLGELHSDQAVAAVTGFVEAAIKAIPTGMQNSFAAHTPPKYIRLELTEAPLSLANAFEKPIPVRKDRSVERSSIEALKEEARRTEEFLGSGPKWMLEADFYDSQTLCVPALIEELQKRLAAYFSPEES
ncbi:CRISPR-associated protein, Cse4 family [Hydrogenimonas sp.]|nr:CRISPR-associated protein, Cse4 family [Hydrogenimonas sp.]